LVAQFEGSAVKLRQVQLSVQLVPLAQPRPYRATFTEGASVVSEQMIHLQKINAESSAKKNWRIIPRPHW